MSHSTCQRQQQVSNADSIPVGTAVPGELPQDIDVLKASILTIILIKAYCCLSPDGATM